MMKKLISLLASFLAAWGLPLAGFGGVAVAQDSFERDFAKFDKDFERLKSWKAETPASKKLKRVPGASPAPATPHDDAGGGHTTPLNDDAAAPAASQSVGEQPAPEEHAPTRAARTSSLQRGLPKGAKVERLAHNERLGHQISDPVMRKKVQDLYNRPDIVVQQYVLPTN